jgi:hypothetical protein
MVSLDEPGMGGVLIKKGTYFLNKPLIISNDFVLISGED